MSTINLPSGSYTDRQRGIYTLSAQSFGAGANELRIRPNTNQKQPSVTLTRYKQVVSTVVVNGQNVTKFVPVSVSLSITMAKDPAVTPAVIAGLAEDLFTVASESNINNALLGGTEISTAPSEGN